MSQSGSGWREPVFTGDVIDRFVSGPFGRIARSGLAGPVGHLDHPGRVFRGIDAVIPPSMDDAPEVMLPRTDPSSPGRGPRRARNSAVG